MNNIQEKKFSNEITLVTGSTQGLGRSIAKHFVQNGIKNIVISGRNENNAKNVLKELEQLGAEPIFIKAELSDLNACNYLIEEIDNKFGKIDILVNSAALTERGTILSTSAELFDKMININVRAPFFLIQACAKIMRREKNGGTIVSISSIASHGAPPHLAPYSLSKAALNNLTKTTAFALMRDHIRVNTLCPGWMDTDGETVIQKKFHNAADDWVQATEKNQPFGRLLKPDEIAKAVIYLCSKDSGIMTGSIIDFDQSVPGVPGVNYDAPYLTDSLLGD
jgi:NAD(P)-dependent dehydrogenase (short-subunit alcohol dehydrogenase family)